MKPASLGWALEYALRQLFRFGVYLTMRSHYSGFRQRIRNTLWRARLRSLGESSQIYPHVVIHTPERISIGARCAVAEFVHMWGGGGITIGDDVMIASHAVITSLTHDTAAAVYRESTIAAPVVLESNVWIGAGAIILQGVRIGAGAIVGAGSVVTRDVPARSVVAGVPARALKRKGATKICQSPRVEANFGNER